MIAWDDFLAFARERVAEYNARPHSTLKKRSPDEVWQGFALNGWQAMKEDAATLDGLFRPRVERTVARAEVRLFNNVYFNAALAELHGETVQVGYDIHDANRVWVYLADGRFVCAADWNANREAYFPQPVVEQKREARADARLRRIDGKRMEVEAERGGRPALTVVESQPIPGISGRDIAGAFERLEAVDVPSEPVTPVRAVNAAASPATNGGFVVPAAPELRIRKWLELSEQAEAGVLLTERETRWLASYAKSHEFSVMKKKEAEACEASA